jgi:hypothetical protein
MLSMKATKLGIGFIHELDALKLSGLRGSAALVFPVRVAYWVANG